MEPVYICNKGNLLNALQEYKIYRALKTHKNQSLNCQLLFKSNKLYDTALEISNKKHFLVLDI